ncbi:MAG: glycerophosphodiester phosphodiesterase [Candidatus Heimdallarchaeota archaeon]|nr:glycerophosphodiester phosphodiesterase [Candidatus Heimdallarchaeota archaeon]
MVRLVSHRGYHKHDPTITENTIPAFQAAVDLGISSIELDTHQTTDGQWVVYHDKSFLDLGVITQLSSDQILKHAENSNFRVDLLEDILSSFPNLHINIESKSTSFDEGKALAEYLDEYHDVNYNISSFSTDVLRGVRSFSEEIKISQLDLSFLLIKISKLHDELSLYSVNPYFPFARKVLLRRAHKLGLEVHVWTVNKEKHMIKMINRNVDAIISDYPQRGLNL